MNIVKDMVKSDGWKACQDAINERINTLKNELVECLDINMGQIRANIRGLKEALAIVNDLADPPEMPDQLPVETDVEEKTNK